MQNLRFIRAYINYYLHAVTKYDVHPPFLYDLIIKVLNDKQHYPGYDRVEDLKNQLLREKFIVKVDDYGAGSKKTTKNSRSIRQIAKYSSSSKKYGRLLFRLARYFKPEMVLELGTSLGLSSAYMALSNPDSKIITIEGAPKIAEYAKKNFETLDIENIQVITGQFDEVLPDLINQISRLDMAFVDGNHKQEPTIRYFEAMLTKSVNETLFVFDDIHWSDDMEKAWVYIINHPAVTLSVDIFFMGIVFLRQELTRQHFMLRF